MLGEVFGLLNIPVIYVLLLMIHCHLHLYPYNQQYIYRRDSLGDGDCKELGDTKSFFGIKDHVRTNYLVVDD